MLEYALRMERFVFPVVRRVVPRFKLEPQFKAVDPANGVLHTPFEIRVTPNALGRRVAQRRDWKPQRG